ncbi:hypothetical protein BS17DRAFT_769882 [Gyrodon lividus]|nr:hypothetical protein BS17DRAFT_769882 [Gyrodon lividus]
MDEMTGSMSLTATVSSLGDDSRGLRAHCTCVTNPQNPNATCQVASNAAAELTTPHVKSAEPQEPAGAPCQLQNMPHKSVGSSARGKTQEANEEDPQSVSLEGEQGDQESSNNDEASQSMSLEGERGHELSDKAGPHPMPRRVNSTSGQAAKAKWQVEGHARVEKTKVRIEGPVGLSSFMGAHSGGPLTLSRSSCHHSWVPTLRPSGKLSQA